MSEATKSMANRVKIHGDEYENRKNAQSDTDLTTCKLSTTEHPRRANNIEDLALLAPLQFIGLLLPNLFANKCCTCARSIEAG